MAYHGECQLVLVHKVKRRRSIGLGPPFEVSHPHHRYKVSALSQAGVALDAVSLG